MVKTYKYKVSDSCGVRFVEHINVINKQQYRHH